MNTEAIQRDIKALQEIAAAQPATKKALLWLEIRHLERERLLCESMQDLVRVDIFSGVRSVVSTAFSLAFLVLIYTKLIELAGWLERARTVTVPLPPPISRSVVLDLSGYVPSSTAIGWFADLPVVSWQAAWKWVAVIVVIVAAEKLIAGYQTWRRAQSLRETAEHLQEEIRLLRGWLEKEGKERA